MGDLSGALACNLHIRLPGIHCFLWLCLLNMDTLRLVLVGFVRMWLPAWQAALA